MNKPTHEELSQRAYHIWQHYGSPSGRDEEIWYEAERQLASDGSGSKQGSGSPPAATQQASESRGAGALADRLKAETAAESAVEYHISPPVSDDEAVKAALQKKEARAPQAAAHTGPKAKPPETGKPLWNKPHSS